MSAGENFCEALTGLQIANLSLTVLILIFSVYKRYKTVNGDVDTLYTKFKILAGIKKRKIEQSECNADRV
jgi:hypothetical protein